MAFSVPDLAYAFDALEPHIDARTMEIHHDKHHAAYVTNLNAALEGTRVGGPARSRRCSRASTRSPRTSARQSATTAAGTRTTRCFWEIMGPERRRRAVRARWPTRSRTTFGGVAELKAAVNDAGVKRFGSGWTWLVWDGTGLAVKSTPNQDTPVMDGEAPLLGIDVWEHAYYLNYQNRRPDYLEAWWNVVELGRGRSAVRSGVG